MEEEYESSEMCFDLILEMRLRSGTRKRPTGKDGRVAAQNIMLIDEFGDEGDKKHSSDFLCFGITITDRKEEMESIIQDVRGKKAELKSRNATPEEKDWTVTRIARFTPETYGTYVDKRKKDYPKQWKGKDRTAAYRAVMKEAIKDALKQTEKDDFLVLMDNNSALKDKGRMTVDEAAKEVAEETGKPLKKIRDYKEVNSLECDMMQAHDFVVGALRDNILDNNDQWIKKLGTKPKRLKRMWLPRGSLRNRPHLPGMTGNRYYVYDV